MATPPATPGRWGWGTFAPESTIATDTATAGYQTPAFDPAEPEPVPEYVFDPSLPEEFGG